MYGRRSILVFLGLLAAANSALAQVGPPAAVVANGNLSNRLRGLVRFELVGGRITATSINVGYNTSGTANGSDGRRESLSIDLTNTAPNVRYELTTKTHDIGIEITDGDQITVRQARKGDSEVLSIEYRQLPREDLMLSITKGDNKRTIVGPTIWHLLLEEPDVAKDYLGPALELLKPNWRLAHTAASIEQTLCQTARARNTADRQRWVGWVAALASPHFSERQSAERQFLEVGREVLPFLQGLDRTALDAEQWRRVRNMITALDNQQSDSVDQIVSLLAGNPRTWVALLNREDETKRQLALEQIKAVTGQPVEFDPAATAEVRKEQLQKVRAKFAPAKAE